MNFHHTDNLGYRLLLKNLSRSIFVFCIVLSTLFSCATHEQSLQKIEKIDSSKIKDSSSSTKATTATVADYKETAASVSELEQSGDTFFSGGNLYMADVQYEKCLAREPNNTRVMYKKGLLLLTADKYQEAIDIFQELLKKEPDNVRANESMGRALFHQEKYADAELYFANALRLEPHWKYYNFLGIINDYQKKPDQAIRYYQKAIDLNPDEGTLYNNLGVSYSLSGDYKRASNAFNNAITHNYSDSKVYNNLGMVLAKSGQYEKALDAFKKGGTEAQAYNNLGCVYLEQGAIDESIRCFEKSIRLNPKIDAVASENLKRAKQIRDGRWDTGASLKQGRISETAYHVVKEGENLYRIAVKYGISFNELCALNNLSNNAVIVPGQKLLIR